MIIGPAHPLRAGGITTFNERLCRAFLDAGHDALIYSFSLQYPNFLFPGKSQFTDAPPPEGITIKTVINSVNPFNWLKAGRMIKREKPDLIICRYWLPFMAPALGSILRIVGGSRQNITVIADNILPHEKRLGDKLFTHYLIPPVSRFVVMSQKVMQDLRGFTLKPARQVPHPLYDNFGGKVPVQEARQQLNDRYQLGLQPQEKLLLFFGLIRDYKGLDILLQALPTLDTTDCRLIIAGEWYIDKKNYEQYLTDPQIASRVVMFDHFVPNDDVKYFFCAADCVIQPYRSATQSGVTPVAYHFDVPMIVTNVGGLPELVPHTKAGIVCEPEPYAIGRAIDAYFDIGAEVFLPGLQTVKKKLSWETLVQTLLDFNDRNDEDGD